MLATFVVVLGFTAVSASAGTYEVHSCTEETGFVNNKAWGLETNTANIEVYPFDISCNFGVIPLADGGSGDQGKLVFASPEGTKVKKVWFDRGSGTWSSGWEVALRDESGNTIEDEYCVSPSENKCLLVGTRAFNNLGTGQVSYELTCLPQPGTCLDKPTSASNAIIEIYSAKVTLEDFVNPTLNVNGIQPEYLRGETVTFSGSDNTGIKEARLYSTSGQHIYQRKSYQCDYTEKIPCKNLAHESFTLDVGEQPNHRELVRIGLVDAADNVTLSEEIIIQPDVTDWPLPPPIEHKPTDRTNDISSNDGHSSNNSAPLSTTTTANTPKLKLLSKKAAISYRNGKRTVKVKVRCNAIKGNTCSNTIRLYARGSKKSKGRKKLLAKHKLKLRPGTHSLTLKLKSKALNPRDLPSVFAEVA